MFGRYIAGNSILHRLDARCKLLILIILLSFASLNTSLVNFIILFAILFGVLKIANIPLRYFFYGIRFYLFMAIFSCFLALFFYSQGNVIFSWHLIQITDFGLEKTAIAATRYAFTIISIFIFLLTTPSTSLMDLIILSLQPLKKLKLPVNDMALTISIAFRFMPIMLEEINLLVDAQKSRGASISSGKIQSRIKAFTAILLPLFINIFRRAEALSTAMVMRGYDGTSQSTEYLFLNWQKIDTITIILATVISGSVIFMQYFSQMM